VPAALPSASPAAPAAPAHADELAELRARLAAAERRADEATAALRRSEAARVASLAAGAADGAHPAGAHPRALVEQLPAIVYTASVAPGHPTLFVTAQVERLLGIPADEWLANPRLWIERVHDDDRAGVECTLLASGTAGA
jgi:PAS domain-containing protein